MRADRESELRKAVEHYRLLAEQLQRALDSRIVVEQAKGVLSERYQVNVDEAFTLLHAYCRSNNVRLEDVARAVTQQESRRAC
ncbi:MAG: ANTAR domain-containing protein [Actinomycetota bacterium]|nr:ANTAR domain-containing protein [Actinomycetota bacterium]